MSSPPVSLSVGERRTRFRKLHESGCFVIPNPWDVGTVRALVQLGFPALATTSAGLSFSRGLPDTPDALSVDAVLSHIAELVAAADVPVNADFQSGYAADPDGVATNARRCIETGVAGFSIEDATGDSKQPLLERAAAVDRIRAARAAIEASGGDVMLTARAECFLVGHPDPLRESITRLQAYADAGADVLYAPGVTSTHDIRAIVDAVEPRPLNVLMATDIGLRVEDLAELGVRRVSLGSALARVAWGAFLRAAEELARGTFSGLAPAAPFGELNALFDRR